VQDNIFAVIGKYGLINMHDNDDVHPLAMLVAIGKPIFTVSLASFGGSLFSGILAGATENVNMDEIKIVTEVMGAVANMGLAIGFILYYVIPFFPFLYMMFAVSGWVKGIFEAMVGLPLFALAHMRIDGNGLPGPVAMNGYFLLFEIFLRPFLIIVGFVSSIIILTTQVQLLNSVFSLVTSNLAGNAAYPTMIAPAVTGVGNFDLKITYDPETNETKPSVYWRKTVGQYSPFVRATKDRIDGGIRYDTTSGAVDYASPVSFTPGSSRKVDVRKTGTHMAVKFESTTDIEWSLSGYDVEFDLSSRRG